MRAKGQRVPGIEELVRDAALISSLLGCGDGSHLRRVGNQCSAIRQVQLSCCQAVSAVRVEVSASTAQHLRLCRHHGCRMATELLKGCRIGNNQQSMMRTRVTRLARPGRAVAELTRADASETKVGNRWGGGNVPPRSPSSGLP